MGIAGYYVWCGAAIISAVKLRQQAATGEVGSCEDLFNQAVDLYLKGDYYQVERLLCKLLDKDARDLDARLMLATLLRHTGRFDEASKQLDQLALLRWGRKVGVGNTNRT